MPNRVSEEFVNVGVVMYQKDEAFLKARIIDKYAHITQFFKGVNGNYLLQTLKFIRGSINQKSNQLKQELTFDLPENINHITSIILPKDDSSLYFTEPQKGVDLNMNTAFEKLFGFFVREYREESVYLTDKEVWTNIYKPFFEKKGITAKLHQKTIKTTTDTIKFDFAYKNGHWNCLEAANFEMKKKDSIENKVFRIIGKLDALSQSKEKVEYHILANLKKKDRNTNQYITKKLNKHNIGNASINLVTPAEIESFTERVVQDLDVS